MNGPYTTGLELILNACEGALQIAITDDEKPLCFQQWHASQRAAEILTPALAQMCDLLGIQPASFRRVGCFAGPGSFTGIRMVLATAAALRRAGNALLASLNYLQALATSAVQRRGSLYGTPVFALTHARQNLIHFQKFISFGPVIPAHPADPARLVSPAQALADLGAEPCLVCGSALSRYPAIFATPVTGQGPAQAPQAVLLPELIHPDLSALRLLARHGDYFPADIKPDYIRGCDAVENLIAQKGENAPEVAELRHLLADES